MLRCFVLLLFWGFSSSSTIKLLVGSQFKLQCLPDLNLMSAEYSWSFTPLLKIDQGVNIHLSPLDHESEELELNPVKLRHAGTYKCVVKGLSELGPMKVKRIFKIEVTENPLLIKWLYFERTEGESVKFPCSSSKIVNRLDSTKVKWFKIKELKGFQDQELKPAVRNPSSIEKEEFKNDEETPARRVYWASDPKGSDWSIEIDSVELNDESLYRCDISTESQKEKLLMELVVKRAPPPRCLNHSHPWEACFDTDSTSGEAILRESLTDFSLQLYKTVKTLEPESNLLFSPISIAVLLSHLLLGARGQTRTQLEHGLFLPSDFSCIHSEMKRLSNKTKDSILIANQMFFNQELKLRETFINQSQEFYDSAPQNLTSDSEANVKLVNNWVASKTQNRITKLVDSLEESTELVLLNAVYFIGKWKGSFVVRNGEFMTFSGELLSVPTLYSSSFNLAAAYIRDLKAHVGKFILTGKNSLYVLLPFSESKKGLQALEEMLTETNIRAMVREMASVVPTLSEVSLPKMKLLVNTDLRVVLKKLELLDLFDDPNLCGMFDQKSSTPLTDARHRAFLSLTEKGVEAAAATSFSYSRSFISFNAMRPFILMVWNEEISNPLFIGRVLHPQRSE